MSYIYTFKVRLTKAQVAQEKSDQRTTESAHAGLQPLFDAMSEGVAEKHGTSQPDECQAAAWIEHHSGEIKLHKFKTRAAARWALNNWPSIKQAFAVARGADTHLAGMEGTRYAEPFWPDADKNAPNLIPAI